MDQRQIVLVRGVDHPVRVGRHSQQRDVFVIEELVPGLEGPARLWKTERAGAATMEPARGDEVGRVGDGAAAVRFWLEDHQADVLLAAGRHRASTEIVENGDGEVGGEVDRVGVQLDVMPGAGRSRQPAGRVDSRADHRARGDVNGTGIHGRCESGEVGGGGVVNHRARRSAHLDDERIHEGAALL